MIQQILAIAGVDNMDEFHKKYPTKEKFLKAYPEASRLFQKHEQENFNPVAAYGGSMDHLDQMQYAKGGSVPQNSKLWSQAKALAKSKFDVYPSKYANNWAAKWYKSKGGTWRKAAYGGIMQVGGGVSGNTMVSGNTGMPMISGSTMMSGSTQGFIPQSYYPDSMQGTRAPMPSPQPLPYMQFGNGGGVTKSHEMNHAKNSMPGIPIRPTGYELRPDNYMGKNAESYKYSYAAGGETDPVELYGMRGEREDARMEAASQLLQLIDTYAQLVGSDLDTEVANMDEMDDSQKKIYVMKMVKTIKDAHANSEGAQEGAQEDYSDMSYKKGGIHLDPAKRGTFTAQATRMGMGVQEAARHILANKDRYSSKMVRKANFAHNASKWKHEYGGHTMPGYQYGTAGVNTSPDPTIFYPDGPHGQAYAIKNGYAVPTTVPKNNIDPYGNTSSSTPTTPHTFYPEGSRQGYTIQNGVATPMPTITSTRPAAPAKPNIAGTPNPMIPAGAYGGYFQEGGETMGQEQMEGAPQQAQEQAMGQEQQPQQGGGGQDQMMQQLMQMVAQALQQGMKPEQIIQMLVQQGIPQDVATQVVQMVMQQMQGGAPQGGPGQQYQPQGDQYQGPQGQQPQAAYGGYYADGGFFNESYMPFDY